MGALEGRSVLITAEGYGIGHASAIACGQADASGVAVDIDADTLNALPLEYPSIQRELLGVRSTAQIGSIASRHSKLDSLFNCSGIVHHGNALDDDAWALSMDVNVSAMVRMCRAVVPGMLDRAAKTGSVSILNMASMASFIKRFTNRAAYGATKAAVIGLTKSVAAELAKTFAATRCVPAPRIHPSLRDRIAAAPDPVQAEKDFIARQPIGRLATVDDITPVAVFLLSPNSQYVTGQAVLVDGEGTI